jgi:hypothetical protein
MLNPINAQTSTGRKKRGLLSIRLGVAGVILGLSATSALAVDGPKVSWNLSVWGPPRAFTAGIETLASYVSKETDGKFTIKIHYGDSLSKASDNLDNIKLGAFEMAQICTGYHPGKHPGINALDLPGLPLADPEVHAMVHDVFYKNPYIVNEFKRWNAMVLMSVLQPQSEFMGTGDAPTKMADFKGMRVRALGGTGAAMKNLGAVPTSVPAPEVYTSMERGVFRAAAFPYTYAFASYKIADIAKWGSSGNRVGDFGTSDRRQHACEDLEPEIFLISQPVRAALDDADLVVEALDEAERDFVFRLAVCGDAIPMPIDHLGEFFKRFEPLPLQA